jgi:biopolymer transport protein ExbD
MRFDGGAAGVAGVAMAIGGGSRPRRPLGLTPLIDVVFLLVIFFMLASRFGDEGKLVLDVVAAAPAASEVAQASRRIDIDASGALRLQGESVAKEELERALALHPERPVLVLPAGDAPLQSIVTVLEIVGAAGVTRAALAPAEETSPTASPSASRGAPLPAHGNALASS